MLRIRDVRILEFWVRIREPASVYTASNTANDVDIQD